MAAKTTKAQLAAAKAATAAPGPGEEEGVSASTSDAPGAPGDELGAGAAPGSAGVSDEGFSGDGAAGMSETPGEGGDAAPGDDDSAPGAAGDGNASAEGDAGATPGATSNVDDAASTGPGGESTADALATAAAEGAFAAFEGAAKDLGELDPEAAAAATTAALLAEETAQTTAENAPAEPVVLNVWAMPDIWEYRDFPALLTLSNNTASRFSVKSVNRSIPPHESITVEFDREQYENLKRSLAGPSRLDKWDSLYGVQVKHESDRTESND